MSLLDKLRASLQVVNLHRTENKCLFIYVPVFMLSHKDLSTSRIAGIRELFVNNRRLPRLFAGTCEIGCIVKVGCIEVKIFACLGLNGPGKSRKNQREKKSLLSAIPCICLVKNSAELI